MVDGIYDKRSQILLSSSLMKEAKKKRLWMAIGFNEWIHAESWWLRKAQSQNIIAEPHSTIPVQGFADLIKA